MRNLLFFISILLYIISKIYFFISRSQNTFLANYLADLLCLPVVLFVTSIIIGRSKFETAVKFSPMQAVVMVGIFAVAFEVILPMISSAYTADLIDILMYILGAGIYLAVQEIDEKLLSLVDN